MELMVVVNCIDLNGLHCHFYLVDYVDLMPLKNSISVFMNAKNILEDLNPVVCPVPEGTRPKPRSNVATMSPLKAMSHTWALLVGCEYSDTTDNYFDTTTLIAHI